MSSLRLRIPHPGEVARPSPRRPIRNSRRATPGPRLASGALALTVIVHRWRLGQMKGITERAGGGCAVALIDDAAGSVSRF